MPPPRPSAFQVSYPDEDTKDRSLAREVRTYDPSVESRAARKRKREKEDAELGLDQIRPPAQAQQAYYCPTEKEISEEIYHALSGADVDGLESRKPTSRSRKPYCTLDQFTFFDPGSVHGLVVLVDDNSTSSFRADAVGLVTSIVLNEEDAGQEDDIDSEQLIRLKNPSKVQTRQVHHVLEFCVETPYAVYVLGRPSPLYETTYELFNTGERRANLLRSVIQRDPPDLTALTGNKDLAVLKTENLQKTTVTPLIYSLAKKYFLDDFEMVGRSVAEETPRQGLQRRIDIRERERLKELVKRIHNPPPGRCENRKEDWLDRKGYYASRVMIDKVEYSVGDTIIVPEGQWGKEKAQPVPVPDELPSDARMTDYCWFARIISINIERDMFHIQWYQAGVETLMGSVSHPYELFLTEICDDFPFKFVLGAMIVHKDLQPEISRRFFCRMMFDLETAAYTDIGPDYYKECTSAPPPHNCLVCLKKEEMDEQQTAKELKDPEGFAYMNHKYHMHDFVLIRTSDGPCDIGQITELKRTSSQYRTEQKFSVVVRFLGRVGDVKDRPQGILKDEVQYDPQRD
ncbi:hypothetical protein PUNSTDRAFT_140568 [Punctularia strigosozonata HHB-11173 SS5]|uniref:uncharacterized protein n=1 Tax=Punctularia strigosozonata (strain HHB-11173) TaxID=741275 RepID=UPI0004417CE8|nr:uncharacterized protein PUNSTDRAFT_140568 [Punctularia strigosozonata HHB-11173 SS5]EIN14238.1 hypothetical protein PUNSTDRAFT_140568 [Punctularia strigosozonata HHB-11173 SS5]